MSLSIVNHVSRSFVKPRIRPIQRRMMSSSSSTIVKHVSECFIKPRYEVPESKQRYYLSPHDLSMLSFHYIQIGLVFPKPRHVNNLLENLKKSLSKTLDHYYPLAGQLATEVDEERHQCSIFVDCNNGLGARFIHASALSVRVSDILTPVHVPDQLVHPLFDHHEAVNQDGHSRPLLSVQVTELQDGVFIGCSMNHALGDGTSFWNFWKVWSETHREIIDNQWVPIINPWVPEGYNCRGITLPFTHPDEFITRHEESLKRTGVFHFSSESLARLKSKARKESISNDNISKMQALFALFWRAYVRSNRLSLNDFTNCMLCANGRHRLNPPLSSDYFGNFVQLVNNKIKVSDLLEHNLGWAASLLNNSVAKYDDKVVRDYIQHWLESPYVYRATDCFNRNDLMLMNSPLFSVYDIEFGFGKPLAARSGNMFKYNGIVLAYQGCEGGGSMDLEICLSPDSMTALESDPEFMSVASIPSFSNNI